MPYYEVELEIGVVVEAESEQEAFKIVSARLWGSIDGLDYTQANEGYARLLNDDPLTWLTDDRREDFNHNEITDYDDDEDLDDDDGYDLDEDDYSDEPFLDEHNPDSCPFCDKDEEDEVK